MDGLINLAQEARELLAEMDAALAALNVENPWGFAKETNAPSDDLVDD